MQQFTARLFSLPKPNCGTKPIQGNTFIPSITNHNELFEMTFYICGGRTHSTERNTRNILSDIVKFKYSRSVSDDEEASSCKIDNIPMENVKLDSPRHNHTSLYFECIDSIVTFGGSNTEHYFDSIFVMNVHDEKKQYVLNRKGETVWPQTRHGHTANVYKQDQMIVFGGKKGFGVDSNSYLNDLWSYNVKSKEWSEIKSLNVGPRERCWHSAVIYKERFLLVTGGFYTLNGGECYLNDLWSFDLETKMWTCLIEDNGKTSYHMHQRNRSGIILCENSLFVMFGNYFDGSRDHFLNDIFHVNNLHSILFEKDSLAIWTKLQVQPQDDESKKLLNEGRGHTNSVLLSENLNSIEILLFGGESFKKRHDNFFTLKIDISNGSKK